MNRAEYMKQLGYRLRRLPKEDYIKAMDYYEEYFEEAGAEHEAQAIEDLGAPEQAADQIIRDFAVENAKEPAKNVKKGFSAVWIGILALFAAPVGLPLALVLGVLGLTVIIVVAAFIFAIVVMAFAMAVSGIPCVLIGMWMLFTSFADGVATIGVGLIGIGIGIWLVMACMAVWKWFANLMTRLFGRVAKGGKRDEKYDEK